MVDVSIILVNYNTLSLLNDALDSLFCLSSGFSFEVIVVDNNSSQDPSPELASRFGDRVRCVRLPKNVGFGRANNVGFDLASGRMMFLLNPDTVLINNAIKILLDYIDSHPKVGVVGGNLYDKEHRAGVSHKYFGESLAFELDSLFYEPIGRLIYGRNRVFNHTSHPLRVAYIIGADMMIRRSVLDCVSGFDPDFFMYAEESELSFRVRKAGYQIINVPQAKIVHLEGGSFDFSENRERMMLRGKVLYYEKCYGRLSARSMIFIRKAMMISRIMVLWMLSRRASLIRHRMLLRVLQQYSFDQQLEIIKK